MGENDGLLVQETLQWFRAHARAGPIRRRRVELGAHGETFGRRAAVNRGCVTPAGPAMRPHTALRPENDASRAYHGEESDLRSVRI